MLYRVKHSQTPFRRVQLYIRRVHVISGIFVEQKKPLSAGDLSDSVGNMPMTAVEVVGIRNTDKLM